MSNMFDNECFVCIKCGLPEAHEKLRRLTIMCMFDILSLQNPAQNELWFS